MQNFSNIYKNKKVLITGHTGFKGSWLTLWLNMLGANILGYSIDTPTNPSMFKSINIKKKIIDIKGDVRNFKKLDLVIKKFKPEIIFHLAAQPIVTESYKNPQETFTTNILGTLNVLECVRQNSFLKACVIVTSDKCYKNRELYRGYKENDQLAGVDPYSASKSSAEIISHSYFNSFFTKKNVATARAGNVIGGGDWSSERVVPDYFRALQNKKKLKIRNPNSTRPWQHVLEPLGGYLLLGKFLIDNKRHVSNNSYNFGPGNNIKNKTVLDLVKSLNKTEFYKIIKKKNNMYESKLLQLNCIKAAKDLNWRPVLDFQETINFTKLWYENFINKSNMYDFSKEQILEYSKIATYKKMRWLK